MKSISSRFSLILKKVGTVVIEYPAAVAFGFFFAVLQTLTGNESLSSGSFTAILSVSLFLGTVTNVLMPIIWYRFKFKDIWNVALTGIGIVIPFAAFLILYTNTSAESGEIIMVRLVALAILEILAAIMLLVYKREGYTLSEIARCLLKNIIVGLFAGAIVFAVIFIPLLIVGVTLWSGAISLYPNVITIALFVVYLFILNAVSELTGKRKHMEDVFPDFMNRLVSFLLIPLMTIWLLYTAVWLIRGMWWNSWASAADIFMHIFPLCLAGYIVCMLTYALEESVIFKAFRNFYTVACVPVIIIGVWRLVNLITAYGFTEKRYFALLGYILLIIGELYLIFNPKVSGIPLLITVAVLAVGSVLPAINYENVAVYSQVQRAENIMYRNNMLEYDEITPPESISEEDRIELSRAVEFICSRNKASMAKWLPLNFNFKNDYAEVFGVSGEYDANGVSTVTSQVIVGELGSQYYNISDYDISLVNYVSYNLYNFSMDNIIGRNGTYSVKFTDYADENITVATVTKDGITVLEQEITDNLGNIAAFLSDNVNSNNDTVYMPMGIMNIRLHSDEVDILVVLKSVTIDKSEKDNRRLTTALTDTILIKENIT